MVTSSSAGTKGVPRAQREEQILDVATAEFGMHGYAGASMAPIARQVGVTKPLIYQYFGSKEGLYVACMRRAGERLTAGVAAAMQTPCEPNRMPLAVLNAIFTTFDDDRHSWALLRDETVPHRGEIAEVADDYRVRLAEFARIGSQQLLGTRGLTDSGDVEVAAQVWTHMVDALVSWWITQPDEDADVMTRRCERIMEKLFGW